jgi:hypothetical protein
MTLFIVIITFLLLAAGFTRYLVTRDQGEHEPVAALWTAFGLGMAGLVIAGSIEYFITPAWLNGDFALGSLAWISLGNGIR